MAVWNATGGRNAREAPDALKKLQSLKALLQPFGEPSERARRAASKEELLGLLKTLEDAVGNFDMNLADETMRRLNEYSFPAQCATQIELLKTYMADVAMEEVLELAKSLRRALEELPEDGTSAKEAD